MATIGKKESTHDALDSNNDKSKKEVSKKLYSVNGFSFTAIIEKGENGWYVGQLLEYPDVISQGKSIKELQVNLLDALKLIMEVNREETKLNYIGKKTIKRKIMA